MSLPLWLDILKYLAKFDNDLDPKWSQTSFGLSEALDLPYVTIRKNLVALVDGKLVERDDRFMVGKNNAQGKGRRAKPYVITSIGRQRLQEIADGLQQV